MEITSENFELIQSQIISCEYCQGTEDDGSTWIIGYKIDLNELLFENDIQQQERDFIIQQLKCPNCGNPNFNEYSNVGILYNEIFEFEGDINKAMMIYFHRIDQYTKELAEFPSLALNNQIGKDLFELIKERKYSSGIDPGVYYRCRKADGENVLDEYTMNAPPKGYSNQGRYNYEGQSHFYLSAFKETAIQEILQGSNDNIMVWVQKFKIIEPIKDLLDLRWDQIYTNTSLSLLYKALIYSDVLSRKENNQGKWKPDYYFTRFIMDCTKFAGYSGIIYNSVFDRYSYNIVLFDCKDERIKAIMKPKILATNSILKKKPSSKLPF